MSEIGTIISVGGALGGVIIGAVLEYARERWRYKRDEDKRLQELNERTKKNYLSPLCFFIQKLNFSPLPSYGAKFKNLIEPYEDFIEFQNEISSIEELVKGNMHVLPDELNATILYYISISKHFLKSAERTKKKIEKSSKNKNQEIPQKYLEGLKKFFQAQKEYKLVLMGDIYSVLKSKEDKKPRTELLIERGNKLEEAHAEMIESLSEDLLN